MSEAVAGGGSSAIKIGGLASLFMPHPSIDILKFLQGIIEIVARGVCLVAIFIMFIASSVAQGNADNVQNNNVQLARAAAGWTIFVGVVALLYELLFIACRFLNFPFMTKYRQIFLIVDIIFNAIVALSLFAGAVSMAVGAEFVRQFIGNGDNFQNFYILLTNSLGAASFFSFMAMFIFIFLAVWMVLYLVLGWDIKSTSSSGGGEKPVD